MRFDGEIWRQGRAGLAVVAALGLALAASTAWACPMCADNLPTQAAQESGGAAALPNVAQAVRDADGSAAPPRADLARGFYLSILLMLAVPYTMLLGGGLVLWRLVRRRQALEAVARATVTQAA